MNIELRPLAEIKPYDKNPRINDVAVDAVAESIRQFGFRQPIVVDGEGVIVVGHTDSAGRDAYNQKLAIKRAEAVREALTMLGVDGSIIDPVSVGESGQEKKTKDGVREGANRRVTIKLY